MPQAMPPAHFSPYPYPAPYTYTLQQLPKSQPHVPARVTKAGTKKVITNTSAKKRKAPPATAAAARKKPAAATSIQKRSKATISTTTKGRKAPPAVSKKPAVVVPEAKPPLEREHVTWETRYEQLVHFQKGHGHCRVPVRHPGLGMWVSRIRSKYQDNFLRMQQQQQQEGGETGTDTNNEARTPEVVINSDAEASKDQENLQRFEKLNQLGFHWKLRDASPSFEERFQDLVAFKEESGHCRVKRSHPLGEWVHNLRKEYKGKEGRLSVQSRVTRLLELGFEFSVSSAVSWEQRLEQLMDFRRKYGHVNVFEVHRQAVTEIEMGGSNGDGINEHEDGDKEGTTGSCELLENDFVRWVEIQQRAYWTLWKLGKKCPLNKSRIKQLQDMGFDFGPERQPHAKGSHKGPSHHRTDAATYISRLEQLREYKIRHGDCLVPREWPENTQLGSWVASQRKQYRSLLNGNSSSLTKERRVELDSMGFVWVVRPWNLKENRKRKDDPQKDDPQKDDPTTSSGESSE
jgi:hypothetical protein